MVRNKREDIAMLIQFSVSNFLSFNEKETFSMIAGKARKNIDRVFSNKKIKLTKCEVILGANASGGFSNKFFRLNPENKTVPSEFEIELLCGSKIFVYGFSVILSTGSVLEEYLYEKISPSSKKMLFSRDTALGLFDVGN